MTKRLLISIIGMLLAVQCAQTTFAAGRIERVSAEQLLEMLDRPEVVVVDVRSPSDWNKSQLKIKGAVREDLSNPSGWMEKYPKQNTLVFYCA